MGPGSKGGSAAASGLPAAVYSRRPGRPSGRGRIGQTGRVDVPFGDDLTPPQRVTRMLQIIDDLLPLAGLSLAEFCREDPREEAAAYAAARRSTTRSTSSSSVTGSRSACRS
jgi:hypothetical protein